MAEVHQLDFLIDGGELGSWVVPHRPALQLGAPPDTNQAIVTDPAPVASLAERLYALGLPRAMRVTETRNRVTVLSWSRRGGLRLHARYAAAPDEVLRAVVRFLQPRLPRRQRLEARRIFLAFPMMDGAAAEATPRRPRRVAPEDVATVERLGAEHRRLNQLHFDGALRTIDLGVSTRMRRRLGEFHQPRGGAVGEIILSRRHIRRDGWASALDTLLHEMIHQWQAETGLPVDHGRDFRRKATAVGVIPRAVAKLERNR
jgi:hypothetical protein